MQHSQIYETGVGTRFMRIFAGVCSNESGVVENGDFRFFRSLYLPNLHIQGPNYYIVLHSPLVALHWHTQKQMTLTDLKWSFCVKICFGLARLVMGWRSGCRKTLFCTSMAGAEGLDSSWLLWPILCLYYTGRCIAHSRLWRMDTEACRSTSSDPVVGTRTTGSTHTHTHTHFAWWSEVPVVLIHWHEIFPTLAP